MIEQFVHCHFPHTPFYNGKKYTVYGKIPERKILQELMKSGTGKMINMELGFSYLNPKDNYCKSIGRELSKSRTKNYRFVLDRVEYINQDAHLIFRAEESLEDNPMYLTIDGHEYNHDIEVEIKLTQRSERPHLVYATNSKTRSV